MPNSIIENALKQAGIGFEIHWIEDGETARNYTQAPHSVLPDLVLLDLNLPRIDGVALLRLIRQEAWFESVPVIVWSSYRGPGFFGHKVG